MKLIGPEPSFYCLAAQFIHRRNMTIGLQRNGTHVSIYWCYVVKLSYAQKLVTVRLGGVLKLLDPVLELNPLNDFWQSICAAELPPFLLG